MSGVLKAAHRFDDLLGFTGLSTWFYSQLCFLRERTQSKICQGKRHMGWSLGRNDAQASKNSLPMVLPDELTFPVTSCEGTSNAVHRVVCDIQCPGIGRWSLRQSLPGTYNSRFPEGKVVSTNHTVHTTDSLGIVSHVYQYWEWWKLPKSQVPRRWPRAHFVSRSLWGFPWFKNFIPTIFSRCR